MPDNVQRDANISRLFEKLEYVADKVTDTQREVGVLGTKIDDFGSRLKRLEDRDEKHGEREEKLELLATKLEGVINKSEGSMSKLENRVEAIESDFITVRKDIGDLKKNWKILVTIVSLTGSAIGFFIKIIIDVFTRGGFNG